MLSLHRRLIDSDAARSIFCRPLNRSGFEVFGWFGLLATAGTPAPVIRKLYAEVVRIVALPEVKTFYLNAGLVAVTSTSPADFDAFIQREREKWAKVIRAANIRIE